MGYERKGGVDLDWEWMGRTGKGKGGLGREGKRARGMGEREHIMQP